MGCHKNVLLTLGPKVLHKKYSFPTEAVPSASENSDNYPLYSVEFLADINGDGKSDLISRSVTEFNVSYDIFEYKNGAFVRVLSETMKVK